MDMALGLRTMVIPTANSDSLYSYSGTNSRREWTIHLQVCVAVLDCMYLCAVCFVLVWMHGYNVGCSS